MMREVEAIRIRKKYSRRAEGEGGYFFMKRGATTGRNLLFFLEADGDDFLKTQTLSSGGGNGRDDRRSHEQLAFPVEISCTSKYSYFLMIIRCSYQAVVTPQAAF